MRKVERDARLAALCPGDRQVLIKALDRARELVYRGWTRGTSARDRNGKPVPFDDKRAFQFCPMGALARVLWESSRWDLLVPAELALAGHTAGVDISLWNDRKSQTKGDVLLVFHKALEEIKCTTCSEI